MFACLNVTAKFILSVGEPQYQRCHDHMILPYTSFTSHSRVGIDIELEFLHFSQGLTAHYLVHDAHRGAAQRGDWVLVHAAGGGKRLPSHSAASQTQGLFARQV